MQSQDQRLEMLVTLDHNISVTFDILVFGDNFAAHQKICKQVECARLLNLKIQSGSPYLLFLA